MKDILKLLEQKGVSNVIPQAETLAEFLESGTRKVYMGIDPTATNIHIGHAVPLRVLQLLSEMGHEVTFLVGDFTALIGDNSDKETERPVLTREEIEANFVDYKQQASKVIDFDTIKIVHNSEWLSKLNFEDIIKLCQQFSAGEFVSRDLIRKRLDSGKRVGLHELLYPVMQGYDMYQMDMDIQVGGTDQTFNMQAGRILQKSLRGKQTYVLALEFLMGTDGQKMSKTSGNAIWLNDSPIDMYGKVMSIADDLIVNYARLGTNWGVDEVEEITNALAHGGNPMELKKRVAYEITRSLSSIEEADEAAAAFVAQVQHKEVPEEIPVVMVNTRSISMVEFLHDNQLVVSKSEARRLIEQGGMKINGESYMNWQDQVTVQSGDVVQLGKRRFIKIQID